jgi:HNH endonuclease
VGKPKYTVEVLQAIVGKSRSVSEVLLKLGLRISGGGHAYIKRRIQLFGIDTTHFLGKRANCGPDHRGGPRRCQPFEVLVLRAVSAPPIRVTRVRRALHELGRQDRCEICGLGPTWQGKALVLEIDHVNGRHHDYRAENLRFLCPNCHSQTVNFAGRNARYAEVAERQTPTA